MKEEKSEICKNWKIYGDCRYKNKCKFAHGKEELKETYIHYNFKTKKCNNFHKNGFCQFGERCIYLHNIKTNTIYYLKDEFIISSYYNLFIKNF